MTWDYAELSKAAKAAGGPDKLLDLIEDNARHIGRVEGRSSMIPWMIIVMLVAAGLTYGTIKLIEHRKAKKTALLLGTEEARSEIIHLLNEQDATNNDDNTSNEGEEDHGQ